MIGIIKSDRQQLIIKRYPAKMLLAFILLFILLVDLDYYTLFYLPVYSSLTCTKGFLNNNTCTLAESSSLNNKTIYSRDRKKKYRNIEQYFNILLNQLKA